MEEQNKIKFEKGIKENKEHLLSLKNEVKLPIITDIETNSNIFETNYYQDRNGQDLPLKDVFNMIIKRGEYGYEIKREYYGGTYQKTKFRLRRELRKNGLMGRALNLSLNGHLTFE